MFLKSDLEWWYFATIGDKVYIVIFRILFVVFWSVIDFWVWIVVGDASSKLILYLYESYIILVKLLKIIQNQEGWNIYNNI